LRVATSKYEVNPNGSGVIELIDIEAKWPLNENLTGGVIKIDQDTDGTFYDDDIQGFFDVTSFLPFPAALWNGATAGPNGYAHAVAANNGLVGTGDWVTICRMKVLDGPFTLNANLSYLEGTGNPDNGSVGFTQKNETNTPGFLQ
jgi:hypothetical protein